MKCEAIRIFLLDENTKLTNIKRIGEDKNNYILIGDIFECDKNTCDKLKTLGLVKVLEEKKETVKPIKTRK